MALLALLALLIGQAALAQKAIDRRFALRRIESRRQRHCSVRVFDAALEHRRLRLGRFSRLGLGHWQVLLRLLGRLDPALEDRRLRLRYFGRVGCFGRVDHFGRLRVGHRKVLLGLLGCAALERGRIGG